MARAVMHSSFKYLILDLCRYLIVTLIELLICNYFSKKVTCVNLCKQEAQIRNEKYLLEKRISYMRLVGKTLS